MLLITGNIVDPIEGVFEGSIAIEGERILRVTDKRTIPEGAKEELIFPETCYIFPGFIDPHVHLREPGWEHKEDFYTGGLAALHGGVTTVADMPNLPVPITDASRTKAKIELAKKSLIDVLHMGGVGRDLSNIRELAQFVPAFKIYTAESTGELALESWQQIEEAVKLISATGKGISFHCENQEINDEAKERLESEDYAWKHCDERPRESEITAVEHVISFCRKHGALANIAHMSTAESVRVVKESKDSMDIVCEAAPHHLFFTKKDMKSLGNLLKVNCPLRDEKDRLALLNGLKTGTVDMLATDHAPHTLKEKSSPKPPSGMPGLDTYGNFVLWLMHEHNFALKRVAEITSYNAARFLGLEDRGRIKENFLANITVLDTAGITTIRNEDMKTKCGWTPFDGLKFPGRIACTIYRGKILKLENSK